MNKDYKWISTTNMLVLNDGKILVVKRSDYSENFPGWYILPGGKQEENETPEDTAIRETFEETGIKVANPKLRIIATHLHDYKSKVYIVYIFEAKKFEGQLTSSDEGEAMWIETNELLSSPNLYPDLKKHIKMVLENDNKETKFTYHRFSVDLKIIDER